MSCYCREEFCWLQLRLHRVHAPGIMGLASGMNTISCYPWNQGNDYISLSFIRNIRNSAADCFCRNISQYIYAILRDCCLYYPRCQKTQLLHFELPRFLVSRCYNSSNRCRHFTLRILQCVMFTLYKHHKLKYSRITLLLALSTAIFKSKTFIFKCILEQQKTPLPLTLHSVLPTSTCKMLTIEWVGLEGTSKLT